MLVGSNPLVIPSVPTLGYVNQHFNHAAVPTGVPPAFGNNRIYFMAAPIQNIQISNISLAGTPPHVSYRGAPSVPTSDRQNC